jgi:hypothetical protein
MLTYKVVRHYRDTDEQRVLFTGWTLKQAAQYCSDPETSSKTCKQAHNVRHTLLKGPWFDLYTEENRN